MKAMRWVLLASLALNVALATALVLPWLVPERFGHGGEHRHRPGHGPDHLPNPRHLREVLDEARRTEVEAILQRHRPRVRATFRPLRDARERAHAAMHAEPFDAAALERAFAELRARDAESAMAVQAMLAEVAAALTPEERARMAELMPERRGHRRRR